MVVARSPIYNEIIPLAQIVPHPNNPREHPETQLEALESSLEEYTQYRSVVVWKRSDILYWSVAGHGVVEAAKRRGDRAIRADVIPEDWPESIIDEILVADNEHGRGGVDNSVKLGELLSRLKRERGDLLSIGVSQDRLSYVLSQMRAQRSTEFLSSYLPSARHAESTEESSLSLSSGGESRPNGYMTDQEREYNAPNSSSPIQRQEHFTMAFTVTGEQRQAILAAIRHAQSRWGLVTSQDALVRLCQDWLQREEAA